MSEYHGPDLLRPVITVRDRKDFVLANAKKGVGSVNESKISVKINSRPGRNFSQAIIIVYYLATRGLCFSNFLYN